MLAVFEFSVTPVYLSFGFNLQVIKKKVLFISLLKHHPPCPFECINFCCFYYKTSFPVL